MPNRLADESSPYLLQHANNPVDWYPWASEALEKAKREDKPIFLSIGYSACHWCHVMEHESFENEEIANYLNEFFVNIKVDREERPDLDHIYMQTVSALRNGQGGWPLSAFLTPQRHVFFGGTYWPPTSRVGMPGFDSVIRHVHQAFREQREAVEQQSLQITGWLNDSLRPKRELSSWDRGLLNLAAAKMEQNFDFEQGGFGTEPKFPHPMDLQFLLRIGTNESETDSAEASLPIDHERCLKMVEINLNKMAYGGIHDHLGGGFFRYSTDRHWLIPHFEKMLYDNAQLLRVYTEAYLATKKESYLRVADKIVEYLTRDLLDEAGGFHSSEDADSEGEEGKFYVWTPGEIEQLLGEVQAERFCHLYGVTAHGNFEGKNNLNLKINYGDFANSRNIDKSALRAEMRESRDKLLSARNKRVRPSKDDKVLTSWNAVALEALAIYNSVRNNQAISLQIEKNRAFATRHLDANLTIKHSFRQGVDKIDGFLDDHAYLLNALCTCSLNLENLNRALALADRMIERFWDTDQGGFFFTAAEQDDLISRFKDHHDGSIPSGNGMAAFALTRLARLTGQSRFEEYARKTIEWALPFVQKSPLACGQMLLAMDLVSRSSRQAIVVKSKNDCEDANEIIRFLGTQWMPTTSLVSGTLEELRGCPALSEKIHEGKSPIDGKSTLYLCEDYSCEQPLNELQAIQARFRPNADA